MLGVKIFRAKSEVLVAWKVDDECWAMETEKGRFEVSTNVGWFLIFFSN